MSFMDFALSEKGRNAHDNFLSGIDFDRFQVIGVTEFYQESVQLFMRKLGLMLDSGNTPHLCKADKEQIAFDINSLSGSDIAKIMEFRQADFVLYLKGLGRFRELANSLDAGDGSPTVTPPPDRQV